MLNKDEVFEIESNYFFQIIDDMGEDYGSYIGDFIPNKKEFTESEVAEIAKNILMDITYMISEFILDHTQKDFEDPMECNFIEKILGELRECRNEIKQLGC